MAKDKGPCSIEGCPNAAWARTWCPKHYERWRKRGDPLDFGRKNEPLAPPALSRYIRGRQVFFTATGDSYALIRRVRDGKNVSGRRYGQVFICAACKQESFCFSSGRKTFQYCSHKCAGPPTGHAKLGKWGTRKKYKDALDRLFSVIVRSAGTCVNCGSTTSLQCAHGFSRRYLSVRWDLRNAFCLCARCHMFYTHRPLEWDDWLVTRWGADLHRELRLLAVQTDLKPDYDAVREFLVAETIRRGITANQLPKTISGWRGIFDQSESPVAP